jgi:hypothetical protein
VAATVGFSCGFGSGSESSIVRIQGFNEKKLFSFYIVQLKKIVISKIDNSLCLGLLIGCPLSRLPEKHSDLKT